MSQVFDSSGENDFFPKGGFLYQNPKEVISLSKQVDVYFPLRKRSRASAPFVVSEEPKKLLTIENLPDECLFEVLRRIRGGQDRSAAACVSKRWLMLLSTICKDEMCTIAAAATQVVEPEIESDSMENKSTNLKEKDEDGELDGINKSEDVEFEEMLACGYLTRSLEGKKVTDNRLAAISVGTSSRGGLGKLSIRGDSSSKLTNRGLKAISCGCPSLQYLSMWNLSSVDDEGLSAIATGCQSLEKLDLCKCPSITDKGLAAIAMGCPNLASITLESCANIGDEGLRALGRNCAKLKCISIKNCPRIGDQGIADLLSSAGHVITKANFEALNIGDASLGVIGFYGSAMTDLTLAALRNVNDKGFWVMAKTQHLHKLKSLAVNSCLVSDMALEALGEGCPDLKVLRLRKCPLVSDKGVVLFAKAAGSLENFQLEECHKVTLCGVLSTLVNCRQKLKAIALARCLGIQDTGFSFPLPSICSSLQSLTISNCPGIGDCCLRMLSEMCPKLTHLNLSGLERVTDSGVVPLVENSDTGLAKVDLSGCVNLTDDVITQVTQLHGETLAVLNLDGCRYITDMSLVAIARNCSTLSELNLSNCGITDSGIAALAGASQLSLQILSLAGCLLSERSLPFLGVVGKTLVGLNIQKCNGMSCAAISVLLDQLWRCDVLS